MKGADAHNQGEDEWMSKGELDHGGPGRRPGKCKGEHQGSGRRWWQPWGMARKNDLVSRVWKIAGNWITEGTTLVTWTRKKHDKEIMQWP
jgi:hypothetical protein